MSSRSLSDRQRRMLNTIACTLESSGAAVVAVAADELGPSEALAMKGMLARAGGPHYRLTPTGRAEFARGAALDRWNRDALRALIEIEAMARHARSLLETGSVEQARHDALTKLESLAADQLKRAPRELTSPRG